MIMIYQNFVGRELIGEKVSEDGMFVTIKNPCYIMVIPDESTGKIQIGFQPFSNFSMENMFKFSKDNFVCEPYTPAEQIENGYRAQFSDIIMASSISPPAGSNITNFADIKRTKH